MSLPKKRSLSSPEAAPRRENTEAGSLRRRERAFLWKRHGTARLRVHTHPNDLRQVAHQARASAQLQRCETATESEAEFRGLRREDLERAGGHRCARKRGAPVFGGLKHDARPPKLVSGRPLNHYTRAED